MIDSRVIAELASRAAPEIPSVLSARPTTPEAILASRSTESLNDDPMMVAKNATDLVENTDAATKAMQIASRDIDGVAPDIAQDVRDTLSRAMFFLAAKAPKESPSAPGMPPLPPPKQDINKFQRYIKAIDDPTSIMDDAIKGTLTPEAVEAVRTVYPQVYQLIQNEIALRISNAPKIPYSRRMQLSALLGQDMTGTLRPAVSLSAQSVYQSQGPQSDASRQMPVSRADKLNMADRAEYNTAARKEAQRGVGMWNKRG